MQILIIILIVLVYCLVLNVDLYYIMLGGALLIGVVAGLFTLAFVYCDICLLFSKRKEATFLRMDSVKGSKFQVAYYLVDGVEYPCIFPKEGVLENKLYQKDKTYHVMLNRKLGKVFDRFAVATSVLGLVFGAMISVVVFVLFL